jgi:Protein of unknown function (DUF1569)
MKNLFNVNDREAIIARLQNLRPESKRQWGKMTVAEVLPHLADPIRASLGEKKVKDVSNPITRGIMGKLLLRRLPWPKGAFTSPDFLPGKGLTASMEFDNDRQTLILLIHRLANTPDRATFEPHPVFGALSKKDLGRLYWRHFDHHLRQFGT